MNSVETAIIQKQVEGILVVYYENERPLRGAIGRLDWRFNGHFSNLIQNQVVTGRANEWVYAPLKWNESTLHFFVSGQGSLPDNRERPIMGVEKLETLLAEQAPLPVQHLGVLDLDFKIPAESFEALKERKICVLT